MSRRHFYENLEKDEIIALEDMSITTCRPTEKEIIISKYVTHLQGKTDLELLFVNNILKDTSYLTFPVISLLPSSYNFLMASDRYHFS